MFGLNYINLSDEQRRLQEDVVAWVERIFDRQIEKLEKREAWASARQYAALAAKHREKIEFLKKVLGEMRSAYAKPPSNLGGS
jgi:hypothetical protein